MGELRSPAGTVAVSRTEWVDEMSGRLLNQHERAAAFVRDYRMRTGEWPAIKSVVFRAGVGTGTAWRSIKRLRDTEPVGPAHDPSELVSAQVDLDGTDSSQ